MLGLRELRRVARILEMEFAGSRVQAWVQPDSCALALNSYGASAAGGKSSRRVLLFSCRPEFARVSRLERAPVAPPTPSKFVQYLRAHCAGARISGAFLRNDDRQLVLRLSGPDGDFELLLALLGNRSNLYLLDAVGVLVATSRPLAETRAELRLGAPWQEPNSRAPSEGEDRWEGVADADYLQAVEAEYGERERGRDREGLGRGIERAVHRELRRLDRKLEKLEDELAAAGRADEFRRKGDLLKSSLSKVRAGDRSVTARDWESGEELVIELDPALSPAANMEAYFRRYRKAVRRLSKAGAHIEAVRSSRAEFGAIGERLEALRPAGEEAFAELERIASEPEVARLLRDRQPGARAAAPSPPRRAERWKGVPARLIPRCYRSSDGLEVWVGRSDEGNDHLSTRLARGKDLFFHLDGSPGSHVVLRTEGREDPPSESLLEACELAVRFSKQKNATRADVHVVPIRNVRKPKGAKPGLVLVTGGRTIHLRRDPRRLERILAARIENP